jgi:hypothetical protein
MRNIKFKLPIINFRLILLLIVMIIGAQLVLTYYSNNSFHSFLGNTQDWYKNISVKRIANLTSTSLELLVETQMAQKNIDPAQKNRIIKSFDIIFSQNIMEKNAEEICLFVNNKNTFVPVDDGQALYELVIENQPYKPDPSAKNYEHAEKLFETIQDELIRMEKVRIIVEDDKVFNVFIPFTPNGEFQGVLYMKIVPDLSSISHDFIGSYNNVSLVYVFLVTAGLLIIYVVFSLTLSAKESAQQLASQEHEKFIKEKIEREKENTFTRRIYHAYHKAEKIVGFINMDLEQIKKNNSDEVRERVQKYSNFIGRVIYDMKYYEPPVHSIINPIFRTDLNEVCRFVIENLFLRIWKSSGMFEFRQDYASDIPVIHVNEYIIWEIIEPIIQNSIAHNSERKIMIVLTTSFVREENAILLSIADNGKGIAPELLERDENGIQKLFLENVSTRQSVERQFGYGCYIAYSLAEKYCGWKVSARNRDAGGCEYILKIAINQDGR